MRQFPKRGQTEPEITQPSIAEDLRVREKVESALKAISSVGGEGLTRYFGIDGKRPTQSDSEAEESDRLIEDVKGLGDGNIDPMEFLARLSIHSESSGVDPNALRALMKPRREFDS